MNVVDTAVSCERMCFREIATGFLTNGIDGNDRDENEMWTNKMIEKVLGETFVVRTG